MKVPPMTPELPAIYVERDGIGACLVVTNIALVSAHQDPDRMFWRATESDLTLVLAALSPGQRERVLGPYLDASGVALDALGWRPASEVDQPGRVISSDGDIYDAVFVDGEWWSLDGHRFVALFWHPSGDGPDSDVPPRVDCQRCGKPMVLVTPDRGLHCTSCVPAPAKEPDRDE